MCTNPFNAQQFTKLFMQKFIEMFVRMIRILLPSRVMFYSSIGYCAHSPKFFVNCLFCQFVEVFHSQHFPLNIIYICAMYIRTYLFRRVVLKSCYVFLICRSMDYHHHHHFYPDTFLLWLYVHYVLRLLCTKRKPLPI